MNLDMSSTCPLGIAADELSRWRDGDLASERADYLASHLAECAACQRRLTDYGRMADGLRAIPTPALNAPRFWTDLQAKTAHARVARHGIGGNGDARRRFIGLGAVAAVLLIALGFAQLFALRDGPVTGPSVTSTHPSTATATATSTATATPTAPTVQFPIFAGCPELGLTATQPKHVTIGGFSVSVPLRVHDYPNALLPSDAPNAPYQVPLTRIEYEQADAFHPDPPVNPSLATGYGLQFCNTTGAPHTITSVSVTIASFTASNGPVSIWHVCSGGPYDSLTKQATTGCGSGMGGVVFLNATFQSNHTGASAPALAAEHLGGFGLPITVGAHESTTLLVAVASLTSQGTYALSFDMSVDGGAPISKAPSDGSFLMAPSAAEWTGAACTTAAMQAQIPAATKDTYYVCPPPRRPCSSMFQSGRPLPGQS